MKRGPLQVKDLVLAIKRAMDEGTITDETPIIYSRDDEGNEYQWCVFSPSIMYTSVKVNHWSHIMCEDIISIKEMEYPAKDNFLPVLCIN